MNITIQPGKLSGTINAIPSKSQAHRLLISAAFADKPTKLICSSTSNDIICTADCLRALRSDIQETEYGFYVVPVKEIPQKAQLNCQESGSTLRFLLPIVGALGVDAEFLLSGRLPQRPLSPLWEEMERMGCTLSRPTPSTIHCSGKLRSGAFTIAGNISSQFVTGLLFAAALLPGASSIKVLGTLESRPYVTMTQAALKLFGISSEGFQIREDHHFTSPGTVTVEGDWSNAAFFLAANALGNDIEVSNLNIHSPQGDRAAAPILKALNQFQSISAADIPDLVPVLAIVAGAKKGAVFTDVARLRLKESDRVDAVISMIHGLGGEAYAAENTLTVLGTGYVGGTIDSVNDHRIAMSAAIAATICKEPVTILGAQAVNKSYPQFWEEYRHLGGIYEQFLW